MSEAEYTDASRARLVLSAEARELADTASQLVSIGESELRRDGTATTMGVHVETAAWLADRAHQLLTRAVVFERLGGASWQRIGTALGISKQSAHEAYAAAEKQFRDELAQPIESDSGQIEAKQRLHPAAHYPGQIAPVLDQWMKRSERWDGDQHPVSRGLARADRDAGAAINGRRRRRSNLR